MIRLSNKNATIRQLGLKTIPIISALLFISFLLTGQVSATVYNGNVSYWNLETGTGSTAYDMVGSNNCTLVGSPTWVTGVYGKAIETDGINQYLNCGDVVSLNSTAYFSYAAWLKQDVLSANDYFFIKTDDSTHLIQFYTEASKMYFEIRNVDTGSAYFTSSTKITANVWFHLAVVYDGTQSTNQTKLKVYINGEPVSLSFTGAFPSTTPNLATKDLRFGYPDYSVCWDGSMDDIHILNYSLTQTQITNLYNATYITDSFDSYTLGNLDGQDNWVSPTSTQVVDNKFYDGTKSIYYADTDKVAYKHADFPMSEAGFSLYFYCDDPDHLMEIILAGSVTDFRIKDEDGVLKNYIGGGEWQNLTTTSLNTWQNFKLKWRTDTDLNQFSYNFESYGWSDWYNGFGSSSPFIFTFEIIQKNCYVDAISALGSEPPPPLVMSVTGVDPVSGSTVTDPDYTAFTFDYENLDLVNYDMLLIGFKNHISGASSLLKTYTSAELDPSGTGSKVVALSAFGIDANGQWDLDATLYNTITDYYTFTTLAYPYNLIFNVSGLPSAYAFSDPLDWYTANADYETPTALYTSLTGVFKPIFQKVGEFGTSILRVFNSNEAYTRGQTLGAVFPATEAYITKLDGFFGGFPLASFFKYAILALIAIFIIRSIIHFIPFLH